MTGADEYAPYIHKTAKADAERIKRNLKGLCITPSWKQGLVFWLVHGMPLWQSSCMDPIWPEFEIWKIFHRRPAEILAPWTPGVSHGTKIFGSKIFSYHPQIILFYVFCGFVWQKMLKIEKNCLFSVIFSSFPYFIENMPKLGSFSWFWAFFANKLTKHIK